MHSSGQLPYRGIGVTNNSSQLLVPRLHEVVGSIELGDGPVECRSIKGLRVGRGVLVSEDGVRVDAGEDPGSPIRIRNLLVGCF